MNFRAYSDGLVVHGDFLSEEVRNLILETTGSRFALTIADPPYGNILNVYWDKVRGSDTEFAKWMIRWTHLIAAMSVPRSALYVWGGIGRPRFRPFYQYLVEVERQTPYLLANHITWAKKRAYGVQHNLLFVREELAYLHLGDDITKPRVFHVPLLEEKRAYAGYNAAYPAKSEHYRRTNVWSDITEILRGKDHEAQKPERVMEIPIEVHTDPGEWVLDPFAGSGTTARAARKLRRNFVVVEQDEHWFKHICHSLESKA